FSSVSRSGCPRRPHSFPTRRSSDLGELADVLGHDRIDDLDRGALEVQGGAETAAEAGDDERVELDNRIVFRSGGRRRRLGLGERSEEHTSELQSREKLVCRLLLEKK